MIKHTHTHTHWWHSSNVIVTHLSPLSTAFFFFPWYFNIFMHWKRNVLICCMISKSSNITDYTLLSYFVQCCFFFFLSAYSSAKITSLMFFFFFFPLLNNYDSSNVPIKFFNFFFYSKLMITYWLTIKVMRTLTRLLQRHFIEAVKSVMNWHFKNEQTNVVLISFVKILSTIIWTSATGITKTLLSIFQLNLSDSKKHDRKIR